MGSPPTFLMTLILKKSDVCHPCLPKQDHETNIMDVGHNGCFGLAPPPPPLPLPPPPSSLASYLKIESLLL